MNRFTHLVFTALISSSLIGGLSGQDAVQSDLQKIANRFIPEGMVSAHETVRGKFAESASKVASGNIVLLYNKGSYGGSYEGLVLLPQGSDAYDQYKLPVPEASWSMMDPIAVFFYNADGDDEKELLIIDKCFTGIGPDGAKAFYRTRVYDWNGNGFTHMDALSEKIGNLTTAPKVKMKLGQIARTSKAKPTEMLQSIEFASYNETIDKAAAAGEDWVKLPMQIVARMTDEFSDMRSRTIEMIASTADGADSLTVTVTNDGYLDDSVRGEKFKYELKANKQGVWRLTSASKAWRCQPGHGSQRFSTTKCF